MTAMKPHYEGFFLLELFFCFSFFHRPRVLLTEAWSLVLGYNEGYVLGGLLSLVRNEPVQQYGM